MTAGTKGAFFRKGKQNFAEGNLDWSSGTAQTFAASLLDLSDWTTEVFNITNVVNQGGECKVTTGAGHGLTDGDRVHLTGVQGATGCNGTWIVTTVDATNVTLDGSVFGGTYTSDAEDWLIRLDEAEFLTDVTAAAIEETQNFAINANFQALLGVLDGDDLTWSAAAGDPCQGILIHRNDTSPNDHLICIITEATGLPVILNSSDVVCAWDNGANKIAAL